MELFPIIQPALMPVDNGLPLYKEVKWDFAKGQPIFKDGAPVFVTGKEAVQVWVWKALITARTKYEIYSWDFGNDIDTLIGQNFTADTKRAEAIRYVREALEFNPYITDVSNIIVSFTDSMLTVSVTVATIYGEVDVFVRG